jgi:AcrR family transcriptional regulator
MAAPPARERLLRSAIDYLGARGITELSLRELAEALGTSHRMLIYHFGSKEGLFTEVVQAVERSQRELWDQLLADPELGPAQRSLRLWQGVSDPAVAPHARLFFELYGQALQGREPAAGLLRGDVESWLALSEATLSEAGYDREQARTTARLGLAVVRGLLLDLLATGQRDEVDAAFELFLSRYGPR